MTLLGSHLQIFWCVQCTYLILAVTSLVLSVIINRNDKFLFSWF